jgi:hypothetical protein
MKKLSHHQTAARKHNTDESGESLREAVKAAKKPATKLEKKGKKLARAIVGEPDLQDRLLS